MRQIFTSFISSERYGTHFPRNFRLFESRTRRCRAIYLSNTFSVSSQPASNNPRSKIVSHGFIRKILSLYQRVLRRYRGNVRLWLEFTTFCYSHGSRHLVSEVISQALQLNPTCAGLWSFAAHWEYKRKVCLNFLFIISCLSTERLYDSDIITGRYHHSTTTDLARLAKLQSEQRCDPRLFWPSQVSPGNSLTISSLTHSVVASLLSY